MRNLQFKPHRYIRMASLPPLWDSSQPCLLHLPQLCDSSLYPLGEACVTNLYQDSCRGFGRLLFVMSGRSWNHCVFPSILTITVSVSMSTSLRILYLLPTVTKVTVAQKCVWDYCVFEDLANALSCGSCTRSLHIDEYVARSLHLCEHVWEYYISVFVGGAITFVNIFEIALSLSTFSD